MTLQDEIALTRKAIKHAELQVDQLKERLDFLLVAEQGQKFPTCTTCKGREFVVSHGMEHRSHVPRAAD